MMELTITKKELINHLKLILPVTGRKKSLTPILTHCLVEPQSDKNVSFSATNLEVSYYGICSATVLEHGKPITIPAAPLYDIVRKFPDNVLIKIKGGDEYQVKVTYSLQGLLGLANWENPPTYQFLGMPADQFPPVPEITDQTLVEVESRQLKEMIEKTIFSVSVDDPQYYGILWEKLETSGGLELRLVSTDGHRLTVIQRPLPASEHFAIEDGILIPRKGVAEISRLLAEGEKVGLGLTKKSLALKVDNKFLFVHLLDKKFPNYRRVIPKSFKFRFRLNRQVLFDTIRRISLLSTNQFRGVIFNLTADTLEVNFQNPEMGEGREVIPLTLDEGDAGQLPIQIGFNARYFLEPLAAMSGEEVFLEMNDKGNPCRLMDKDDLNYFSIIAPWQWT